MTVNFLMLLIGVAVVGLAAYVHENERDLFGFSIYGGNVDDAVIYLAIGCGLFIMAISFIGCVGVSQHSTFPSL